MSRRGCFSGIVLLLILVIVALVAVLIWFGSEPNGIRTRVEADRTMLAIGETMALNVSIENVSLDAVLINSVGLERDLLNGLTLVQTLIDGTPQSMPVDERDFPVLGAWTEYSLDREIPPGETINVTFVLEATEPGSYMGEVSTWVDVRPLGLPLVQARRESIDYAVQSPSRKQEPCFLRSRDRTAAASLPRFRCSPMRCAPRDALSSRRASRAARRSATRFARCCTI